MKRLIPLMLLLVVGAANAEISIGAPTTYLNFDESIGACTYLAEASKNYDAAESFDYFANHKNIAIVNQQTGEYYARGYLDLYSKENALYDKNLTFKEQLEKINSLREEYAATLYYEDFRCDAILTKFRL
ncbi:MULTISPECIES: hypothetical protein [Vibrio]|uniref:Uncharacterized protein n=1 Tax=Vibrio splendidus TaxID=29497 RepID=A0AB35MVF4_VIBSP|nr:MULTISPECIES: hypothetical protein [Vibrio]MDH5886897.1 hypothetical protein [Vibrio splendidus]MDH5976319.1 hypothetical protein [Vibrio splendidus]MDP2500462.1 hypothetical protein [Vibrio splendidus]URM14895.1 hypothetical protein KLJ63_05170 [Vibrio splendidus]